MDDPRWLRIVVVGLILAILAVVYFLLTGGLGLKPKVQSNQASKVVVVSPSPSPSPVSVATMSPERTATPSAYDRIASRTQAGVQTLPNTGFPVGLAIIVTAAAIGSGLALRKFPRK